MKYLQLDVKQQSINQSINLLLYWRKSPHEKGKCSYSTQKITVGRAVAMKFPDLTHTPVPFYFLFVEFSIPGYDRL